MASSSLTTVDFLVQEAKQRLLVRLKADSTLEKLVKSCAVDAVHKELQRLAPPSERATEQPQVLNDCWTWLSSPDHTLGRSASASAAEVAAEVAAGAGTAAAEASTPLAYRPSAESSRHLRRGLAPIYCALFQPAAAKLVRVMLPYKPLLQTVDPVTGKEMNVFHVLLAVRVALEKVKSVAPKKANKHVRDVWSALMAPGANQKRMLTLLRRSMRFGSFFQLAIHHGVWQCLTCAVEQPGVWDDMLPLRLGLRRALVHVAALPAGGVEVPRLTKKRLNNPHLMEADIANFEETAQKFGMSFKLNAKFLEFFNAVLCLPGFTQLDETLHEVLSYLLDQVAYGRFDLDAAAFATIRLILSTGVDACQPYKGVTHAQRLSDRIQGLQEQPTSDTVQVLPVCKAFVSTILDLLCLSKQRFVQGAQATLLESEAGRVDIPKTTPAIPKTSFADPSPGLYFRSWYRDGDVDVRQFGHAWTTAIFEYVVKKGPTCEWIPIHDDWTPGTAVRHLYRGRIFRFEVPQGLSHGDVFMVCGPFNDWVEATDDGAEIMPSLSDASPGNAAAAKQPDGSAIVQVSDTHGGGGSDRNQNCVAPLEELSTPWAKVARHHLESWQAFPAKMSEGTSNYFMAAWVQSEILYCGQKFVAAVPSIPLSFMRIPGRFGDGNVPASRLSDAVEFGRHTDIDENATKMLGQFFEQAKNYIWWFNQFREAGSAKNCARALGWGQHAPPVKQPSGGRANPRRKLVWSFFVVPSNASEHAWGPGAKVTWEAAQMATEAWHRGARHAGIDSHEPAKASAPQTDNICTRSCTRARTVGTADAVQESGELADDVAEKATRYAAMQACLESEPRVAALDLLPEHLCGLQLQDLSHAQLEELETLHVQFLRRARERRVELAWQESAEQDSET